MCVVDTKEWGLYQCLQELIHTSVHEHLCGNGKSIEVELYPDGTASVRDYGSAYPIDVDAKTGIPFIELMLTRPSVNTERAFWHPILDYTGLSFKRLNAAVALSETFHAKVFRDGFAYEIEFQHGVKVKSLALTGRCDGDETGTMVTFKPDADIFDRVSFDEQVIAKDLEKIAYLTPGLKLSLKNKHTNRHQEFYFPEGVTQFFKSEQALSRPLILQHESKIAIDGHSKQTRLLVALQFNESNQRDIHCFTNLLHNPENGVQIKGFNAGLKAALKHFHQKYDMSSLVRGVNDTGEPIGIQAVISLWCFDPRFESQYYTKLISPEIIPLVRDCVKNGLIEYWAHDLEIIKQLLSRGIAKTKPMKKIYGFELIKCYPPFGH